MLGLVFSIGRNPLRFVLDFTINGKILFEKVATKRRGRLGEKSKDESQQASNFSCESKFLGLNKINSENI